LNPEAGSEDAEPPARMAFEPVLPDADARIVPRDTHDISRAQISPNALKVLYRLINAGHLAFLVGGGVRDLLLGLEPKDFDVATDALPEEVDELFRNARLIGRRFRLAHVRFGREIIEVATFRGSAADEAPTVEEDSLPSRRASRPDNEPAAARNEGGMILRDNVYGSIDADAERRDFTINALYYTPADFCVYDFAGGLEDLEARRIRLIGDPEQRYREDPVRMLRALRFAAKLDFELAPETAAPLTELSELLLDVPPARLFDEFGKLFLHGKALATFRLMREYHLFGMLFPEADLALDRSPEGLALAEAALANTDERVADERPVTPGFLLAAMLWPAVRVQRAQFEADGMPPREALEEAGNAVLARQQMHTAVPRRFSTFVRETWALQPRLEGAGGRRVVRITEHPRFRAAYDFLVVRERAGEDTGAMGDWWTRYQDADEATQGSMRQALGGGRGGPAADDDDLPSSDGDRRPRRRRRGGRRRRPKSD
jgi:poly(A) polymerase